MKRLFEKKVPKRNYVVVAIVSILVIIIPLYVSTIYLNNKEDILNKSIFEKDSNINQINFNDIDFVVNESTNIVLYISYYSKDIKSMERKLYREIIRNNLSDKIIYLSVNDNKNYIKKLKEKFPNIKGEISDAPLMIYIKNGEAVEAVNSEFKMVDYGVFEKLIDKYENNIVE
jgi:hypothetical protein